MKGWVRKDEAEDEVKREDASERMVDCDSSQKRLTHHISDARARDENPRTEKENIWRTFTRFLRPSVNRS